MKLGEALTIRARQAQKLNDLRGRIQQSALAQEGDAPAEDINSLMEQFTSLSEEHATLIEQINAANIREGLSTDILNRDHLRRLIGVHRAAIEGATPGRHFRYGREEIKWVSHVDVAEAQKTIEDLERQQNELDAGLQSKNWTVDL